MSFGFQMIAGGDTWTSLNEGVMLRQIHEVDNLIEVSPVTFPAYLDTTANVLRNAPEWVRRALLPHGVDDNVSNEARARLDVLRKRLDLMRGI